MKFLLLLMILLKRSESSSEYFLDTCCSLNGHERIYLSCGFNEKIHLNLIEIFYNSDEYCSSESYCCKYQTQCSRRITKYSSLHCDEQNSCWIDKNCLKIYKTCSNLHQGLYGQYLTIHYSCLPLTNQSLIEQTIPFIVKLLASQTQEVTTTTHSLIKQQIFLSNQLKSSPIFLILIIFLFIFFMLFMYWLAHWISQRICQQQRRRILKMSNEKEQLIPQQLLIEHSNDQRKVNVQSNYSLPQIRISSLNKSPHSYYDQQQQQQYSYRSIPYSPYRQYINVQHNPITGQITSRTFNNSYSNYY